MLTEIRRSHGDRSVDELLVKLRHDAACARPRHGRPPSLASRADDPFDSPGIPEVSRAELDSSVLGAALAHRGGLLVRGLLDPSTADHLLATVHEAFAAAESHAAGTDVEATRPSYVPFEANDGYSFGDIERRFTASVGGLLTVESPRALAEVVAAFQGIHLGELLADHLGEWPAISAKKSTLRRAAPDSPSEWHQDGAFLGSDTRTVNVWTSLTHCGEDAPGIEIIPRRFDHIVDTGTDDALFGWSVSPTAARRVGAAGSATPVFAPGDALLFDQMSLHRTSVRPEMTRTRYAIESWFFAPSTYPVEQVPLMF